MHDDLLIRCATGADAADLTRIAHDAKRHWGYPEEWVRMWSRELTFTAEYIERHEVWCAEADGAPAAVIAWIGEGPTREIDHLWVDPSAMEQGLGRALFQHAIARMRGDGVERVRIAADPHAVKFYERMGATTVGRVPSIPEGRELPLMVIDL